MNYNLINLTHECDLIINFKEFYNNLFGILTHERKYTQKYDHFVNIFPAKINCRLKLALGSMIILSSNPEEFIWGSESDLAKSKKILEFQGFHNLLESQSYRF